MRLLRSIGIILILTIVLAAGSFAQSRSDDPLLATWYRPGNIAFPVAAGLALGDGIGLGLYPGLEMFVSKFRAFGLFSLDLAVGARAELAFYSPSLDGLPSSSVLSVAPVVTVHGGFRGLVGGLGDLLEPIDYYTGIGLGFQVSRTGGVSASGLTLVNVSGINYFLTDSFAVSVGTTLFSSLGSLRSGAFTTGVGLVYKFGPAEDPGRGLAIPDLSAAGDALIYASFANLVWLSAAYGGYLPDDETFSVGDSITVVQRFSEGGQNGETGEVTLFRALLARTEEGAWWRYEMNVDGETVEFEALVDPDDLVRAVRFENPGIGAVEVIRPADPEPWSTEVDAVTLSEEDLSGFESEPETLTVRAGTFNTNRISGSGEDGSFTWWLSESVPGRMVRFSGMAEDGGTVEAELVEIGSGYSSPWPRAW